MMWNDDEFIEIGKLDKTKDEITGRIDDEEHCMMTDDMLEEE